MSNNPISNRYTELPCAWALQSPNLMQSTLGGYRDFCSKYPLEIQALGAQANVPTTTDHPARVPLGIYFEQQLAKAFNQAPEHWRICLRNYPIYAGKRTMGELDFLLEAADKTLLHVEAAIKFYLLTPTATSPAAWSNWVGPNAADRLDIKLERMLSHQLPMAASVAAELNEAAAREPGADIQSLYLMKGVFFSHWQTAPKRPAKAYAGATTGEWMYESEFWRELARGERLWRPLSKLEWLAATKPGWLIEPDTMLDHNRIASFLTQAERAFPRLFLSVTHKTRADSAQLTMVVNDHWPETKRPSRST
ncbi:DUF1853 family protein [Teredinibacter turnerae]|uniref:DUF1853 family protein n=1 Tax=Teredinibacter turnerae TaxID=2426 RepID=UPI00036969FD|nr:DUF1853 family protein [Teredinibacter turnerae]